jgi:YggT family protein
MVIEKKRLIGQAGWQRAGLSYQGRLKMTVPPNPPPDREEYVEVTNTPQEYQQRRVTHSPAADQRLTIQRITQVIWLLFGFLLGLIGIRIVLSLIGANREAFFARVVYGITDMFLWPFVGLVGDPEAGGFMLELSAIIAILVYALIAWGVTRLIWVLFYHPETNSVSTYREHRS